MNDPTQSGKPLTIGALLMSAKYHEDSDTRVGDGLKAVKQMADSGDYRTLISISKNNEFPDQVRSAAKENVLEAAFKNCESSGNPEPLHDVCSEAALSPQIRWHAGMELATMYSYVLDGNPMDGITLISAEQGLIALVENPLCPEDPRRIAGKKLIGVYSQDDSQEPRFSQLYNLAVIELTMYEIRKEAGLKLIDLCVKSGNYPLILKLEKQRVPTDVLIATEGQFEAAAYRAMNLAFENRDLKLLEEISSDARLPDLVRSSAFERLESLKDSNNMAESLCAMRLSDYPKPPLRISSKPPPIKKTT